MKASSRARRDRDRRNDRAQVGIGTLIVFIATILTATVAASVVIDTSNDLHEKSQRTGQEATEQVVNNLLLSSIQGKVNSAGGKLDSFNITITVAAGAKSLDISQLVIRVSNGTEAKQLTYNATATGDQFSATEVRDPDGSFTSSSPVLTSGDLIVLDLDLTSTGLNMTVDERDLVEFILQPEAGSKVGTEVRVPSSLIANKVVLMR